MFFKNHLQGTSEGLWDLMGITCFFSPGAFIATG